MCRKSQICRNTGWHAAHYKLSSLFDSRCVQVVGVTSDAIPEALLSTEHKFQHSSSALSSRRRTSPNTSHDLDDDDDAKAPVPPLAESAAAAAWPSGGAGMDVTAGE